MARHAVESADVNCGKWGWPLKRAAGHVESTDLAFLKLLIAAHADMNIDDGAPLREAIAMNNVEGAELLLAAGANPNIERPLFMVALDEYGAHWDPTMIILLLGAGADANYREPYGDWVNPQTGDVTPAQTVLTAAAENGYLEIVRILLEHGADPLKPRHDGQLPAGVAKKAGHLDVAALIEKYAPQHPTHT
jgi:ankyrin repeat protein